MRVQKYSRECTGPATTSSVWVLTIVAQCDTYQPKVIIRKQGSWKSRPRTVDGYTLKEAQWDTVS